MPKFFGVIGFATSTETAPGVWTHDIVERSYTGDVIKKRRGWQSNDNVNPDLTISDTISIIADGFTLSNVGTMKYVIWQGAKWSITNVDIDHPRVTLELGGLYSGQQTGSP